MICFAVALFFIDFPYTSILICTPTNPLSFSETIKVIREFCESQLLRYVDYSEKETLISLKNLEKLDH